MASSSMRAWLVDAAWALATFFVLPALAVEDAGAVAAARRSASVIRSRWGESVVGEFVKLPRPWRTSQALAVRDRRLDPACHQSTWRRTGVSHGRLGGW